MTLLFMDTCDLAGNNLGIRNQGWEVSSTEHGDITASSSGGFFSGNCVYKIKEDNIVYHTQHYIARSFEPTNNSEVHISFGMYLIDRHDEERIFILLKNNGGTDQVIKIILYPDGSLRLYNSANTLIATSDANVIKLAQRHMIKLSVLSHGTAGTINLYVDSEQIFDLSNQDTSISSTDITKFYIYNASGADYTLYDDFRICDSEGASPENAQYPTDYWYKCLLPTADTATADFTNNGESTGYECTDDPLCANDDGDTTYISSNNPGDQQLFAFEDLVDEPASVYGVGIILTHRKSVAGDRSDMAIIKSGSTIYDGPALTPSVTYTTETTLWAVNPDGDVAWERTTINALTGCAEIVS